MEPISSHTLKECLSLRIYLRTFPALSSLSLRLDIFLDFSRLFFSSSYKVPKNSSVLSLGLEFFVQLIHYVASDF